MKLPTFEEAKQALIEKRGTPLDKFVAYWEPRDEDWKFREMLGELMEWARPSMTASEIEEAIADLPRHQAAAEEKMMVNVNYGTQENLIRSFWNPTTGLYENAEAERP